jgi:hypothetical protein
LVESIKAAECGKMGSTVEIGGNGREAGKNVRVDGFGPFEDAEAQLLVLVRRR